MTTPTKRAVIYTRISKDLRDGSGVDRQKDECRKYCEARDYLIVDVLEDNDISAFDRKKKRPAYEQLLDMARRGDMDVIVAWHTDRLYRRVADLSTIVDACNTTGVDVETVQGGELDLSTANGRMIAQILGSIAEGEVDHIVERIQAAHADRAARGRYRGGPVSFGFNTVKGKPGYLVHNAKEAEAVRVGIDDVLAGKSLNSIARKWVDMEVAREGEYGPLTAAKVRRRLSSPRVAGLEPYKGQVYPATTYEAIVPEDKWRAALDVMASNESRNTRGSERKWLGTGIYRCGLCGGYMFVINRKRDNGKRVPSYHCRTCTKVSRKVANVDEVVVGAALRHLSRPENRIRLARKDNESGINLQSLLDRKRGVEARMNELAVLLAEGDLTAGQFRAANNTLKTELQGLDRQLSRVRRTSPLAQLIVEGENLQRTWDSLVPEQKHQVINALMKVTIMPTGYGHFDPSKIKIEWK
ncbi:recombinase family protein [Corynebacterium sp. MSK218]|uniref:recombinase family protein n=1 Tax=Corynebacterium sp. MSK218 TaxID=3050218 RepID=UPI00254CB769|nr:recombinase family protein [Corynebacterium sp. MSK218]MDK8764088.1 recombinase family protein [Corynebacterium sp. MSK218]